MNRQLWIDHLISWKTFLNERILLTEDDGERIKCERQIKTIERVRCGAVLNPRLLSEFINPSTEESEEAVCEKYYFDLNDSQKKTCSWRKCSITDTRPAGNRKNTGYCRNMFSAFVDESGSSHLGMF